jgi:hypothetical protein
MDTQTPKAVRADNYVGQELPPPPGALLQVREAQHTVEDEKKLTELAFKTREFIDANGGLKPWEICRFGSMMNSLMQLPRRENVGDLQNKNKKAVRVRR